MSDVDPQVGGDPVPPVPRADTEGPGADPSDAPWWRGRPSWKRVAIAVFAVVVGYYLISLVQVVTTGRSDGSRQSDAIVVLGAAQYDGRPSPQLAARLDHALTLFEQGVASTVVVTGGKLPGDRFTEAEASQDYLVDLGVPAEAIVLENLGSTTYESLAAVVDLLDDDADGEDGGADVVLVTDPYHALRSRLIADEVGLDAVVSPTPSSVVSGWGSARRQMFEAAGVAVGRIVGFERLSGFSG